MSRGGTINHFHIYVPVSDPTQVLERGLNTAHKSRTSHGPYNSSSSSSRYMGDVFDDLRVAAVRRVVLGRAAGLGTARTSPSSSSPPLGCHVLRFAALRLGELRCYDDQAQVEHEERTDLERRKNGNSIFS